MCPLFAYCLSVIFASSLMHCGFSIIYERWSHLLKFDEYESFSSIEIKLFKEEDCWEREYKLLAVHSMK